MLTMELVKVTFKLSFSVRIRKKRPWVGNLNLWGSSFDGKNKIKMFFTFAEANYFIIILIGKCPHTLATFKWDLFSLMKEKEKKKRGRDLGPPQA